MAKTQRQSQSHTQTLVTQWALKTINMIFLFLKARFDKSWSTLTNSIHSFVQSSWSEQMLRCKQIQEPNRG